MLSSVNLQTLRGLLGDRERELKAMFQANSIREEGGPSDVLDCKDLADRFATDEVRDAE